MIMNEPVMQDALDNAFLDVIVLPCTSSYFIFCPEINGSHRMKPEGQSSFGW